MRKPTCSHKDGCNEPHAKSHRYCNGHKALAERQYRQRLKEHAERIRVVLLQAQELLHA